MASVRRPVHETAIDWNAAKGIQETAELLTAELITDTIAHDSADVPAPSAVRITASREQELLTMDVHDPYPTIPRFHSDRPCTGRRDTRQLR